MSAGTNALKLKRQAEAVFYSFSVRFFQKRIPLVSLDWVFGWTEDCSF
jgi:hypothetical protein